MLLVFAKGLANSFSNDSSLTKKMKERWNKKIEDSMFSFILKAIRGIIYTVAGFIVITELGFDLSGLVQD